MIALAAAAFVASALAQDFGQHRNHRGLDNPTADSAPTFHRDGQNRGLSVVKPDVDPVVISDEDVALERQVNALARQLEATESDARRDEIKAKLGEALGKQFDLRQKRHGLEIEALEARVKKLGQLVRKRQENRAEIISRRLDQLVRESQGLGF
jgi:hypothetical protein